MIIPERTTKKGRVVPAFLIDDQFAEEVGKWKWCQNNCGYLSAWTNGTVVSLARYIWLLHTGDWPNQQIDHINRDKLDNRVENLRDVSPSDNTKNQAPLCRLGRKQMKRSGLPTGVKLHRGTKSQPYEARVSSKGKTRHLGYFATPEEASARYQQEIERMRHETLA